MKATLRFLEIYLITALVLGIASLIDSSFNLLNINNENYNLVLIISSFLFFFLNIFAIITFHHNRVKRIAYVLPIYHIFTYIFFLSLGIYLAAINNVQNWVWNLLLASGFLTSFFEIIFSIYLLKLFFNSEEIPA